MRDRAIAPLLALILGACGSSAAAPDPTAPAVTGDLAPPAAPTCNPAPEPPKHGGDVSWFHDDYAAAVKCARTLGRPLLIDMWAPWCHTCLSMKQTVLVDKALAPLVDRFVWLAVDTDKEVNAEVVGKFPPVAWPTFFVVSPDDQAIQARFVGAASIKQFRELLAEGERAFLDDRAGSLPAGSPLRLVRDAHRAEAAGNHAEAGELYDRALAAAPADWPRRPDVMVSRISMYYRLDQLADCVDYGAGHTSELGNTASAADFTYYASACFRELPAEERSARLPALAPLRDRLITVIDDDAAPLSVDDRSDALRILRELHELAGDEAAAIAAAERQQKLLSDAIAAAPTPFAAMTYNWPAAEVFVYLKQGEKLLPVLEKSIADLPAQYDPPYRLAFVLLNLERHDEALAAAEKALGLAYGPRQAGIQRFIATIYRARGDRAAELAAWKKTLALYQALPAEQQKPSSMAAAEAEIKRLETAPAGE